MELFFKALAVILAGVAAYFLWQGNNDGGFVAAVLGAVSFFLSVRFEVKERLRRREMEREEQENRHRDTQIPEEEISDSPPFLNEAAAGEQIGGAQSAAENELRTKDRNPL